MRLLGVLFTVTTTFLTANAQANEFRATDCVTILESGEALKADESFACRMACEPIQQASFQRNLTEEEKVELNACMAINVLKEAQMTEMCDRLDAISLTREMSDKEKSDFQICILNKSEFMKALKSGQ